MNTGNSGNAFNARTNGGLQSGDEAVLGFEPGSTEARLDELRELVGGNLLEAHHGSGLVEGPLRGEHPLHQARLRPGEHVADRALVLDRGAQRVLHGSAVEAANCLKFVERHDDRAAPRVREAGRQREHFLGEPRDVAIRAGVRECHPD